MLDPCPSPPLQALVQSKGALGVLFGMLDAALAELQSVQQDLHHLAATVAAEPPLPPAGAAAAAGGGFAGFATLAELQLSDDRRQTSGELDFREEPDTPRSGAGSAALRPAPPAAPPARASPLDYLRHAQLLYNQHYAVLLAVLHLLKAVCRNAGLARVIATKTHVPPTLLTIMEHPWHDMPSGPAPAGAAGFSPRSSSYLYGAQSADSPHAGSGPPARPPADAPPAMPCSTYPVALAAQVVSAISSQLDDNTVAAELLTEKALLPALLAALLACRQEGAAAAVAAAPHVALLRPPPTPGSRRGTSEQQPLLARPPTAGSDAPPQRMLSFFTGAKGGSPGSGPAAPPPAGGVAPDPAYWGCTAEWQPLEPQRGPGAGGCQVSVLGLLSQLAGQPQLHTATLKSGAGKDLLGQLMLQAGEAVAALQAAPPESPPDTAALLRLSCSLASLNAFAASGSAAANMLSGFSSLLETLQSAVVVAEAGCRAAGTAAPRPQAQESLSSTIAMAQARLHGWR